MLVRVKMGLVMQTRSANVCSCCWEDKHHSQVLTGSKDHHWCKKKLETVLLETKGDHKFKNFGTDISDLVLVHIYTSCSKYREAHTRALLSHDLALNLWKWSTTE
jgi:hypothetical protein